MSKILIIDDDKILCQNTEELLSISGYDVYTASNGKEGLDKATELQPDLIVCDVVMPELDGYSLLHLLRKNKKTEATPFIFLTAKGNKEERRKGMNLGADDYLSKPFQDVDLLGAVENRLKRLNNLASKNGTTSAFYSESDFNDYIKKIKVEYKSFVYKPKQFIFTEGNNAHYLYLVKKGKVKIYEIDQSGKELIMGIFTEGDLFGHRPLLEGRPYEDSCQALEETELIKVPKKDFLKAINENHNLTISLLKELSRDLSEKEHELLDFAYSSVRKRTLIRLKELIKNNPDHAAHISRVDLAKLVGTTNETLVRTLTDLKKDKVLEIDAKGIRVADKEKFDFFLEFS